MQKAGKIFTLIAILAILCCCFVACNSPKEESDTNSDTNLTKPQIGAKFITLMLVSSDGAVKSEISCRTDADTLEDFLLETSTDTFGYITFDTTTIDDETLLIGFTINSKNYGDGNPLDVFTSCLETEGVSETDILHLNKAEYYKCNVSYSDLVVVDYEVYIIKA